jgi:alkanesulfonate monooxygenase SsuD/methylene tetrahydromethanopterin reductase-like flavin-dependent oxidoreductase (luciferase family)
MAISRNVLFGLRIENAFDELGAMLEQARFADQAGLDLFSMFDHPYFADRVDAYAALGFILGATSSIGGAVICTNLLSRPAPILARTVASLSRLSGGRVVLPLGAGGNWDEIVALGAPRLSPGERVRALEEAIEVVKALTGGGDPVTFDGDFYQVTGLTPSAAPTPQIWVGAGGPKGLAAIGRQADGWIPPHAADWRSKIVAEGRRVIEDAAASAGRTSTDIDTIYNVSGRISRDPGAQTRDDAGRWIGGGVAQWVDELTFAVLECGAASFHYGVPPGGALDGMTMSLWAHEVVPAVREAIASS